MDAKALIGIGVAVVVGCGQHPSKVPTPTPSASGTMRPREPPAVIHEPTLDVGDECTFSGDVAKKYRWDVKRRGPGADAPSEVTVATMLTWPDPLHVEDPHVRRPADANVLIDPLEREAHTLIGDVWVAKVEDNDCDWHLELSAPGAGVNAPRVIVEVPQAPGYTAARRAVAMMVQVASIATQCFKFTRPARITVRGWVFYDGHHFSQLHPHVGWKHGSEHVQTLWELHPVWDVEVLTNGDAQPCSSHRRENEDDE